MTEPPLLHFKELWWGLHKVTNFSLFQTTEQKYQTAIPLVGHLVLPLYRIERSWIVSEIDAKQYEKYNNFALSTTADGIKLRMIMSRRIPRDVSQNVSTEGGSCTHFLHTQ